SEPGIAIGTAATVIMDAHRVISVTLHNLYTRTPRKPTSRGFSPSQEGSATASSDRVCEREPVHCRCRLPRPDARRTILAGWRGSEANAYKLCCEHRALRSRAGRSA